MIQNRSAGAKGVGTGTTSVAITKPSGVLTGDIWLVSFLWFTGSSASITTPAGWTAVGNTALQSGQEWLTFSRVIDGTEGASQTFNYTGATASYDWFSDAFFDDGGGTISVRTSAFSTGASVGAPPATTSAWEAIYGVFQNAVVGSNSIASPNWRTIHVNPSWAIAQNNTMEVALLDVPTASSPSAPTFAGVTGTALWAYVVLTGGTAPSNDVRQRGAASGGATTGSVGISNPAQTGDLLLAFVESNSTAAQINTPSGWTLVTNGSVSGGQGFAVFTKIEGASPPGSYTFSNNTATSINATVTALFAHNGQALSVKSSQTATGASVDQLQPASITPAGSTDLVVCWVGDAGSFGANENLTFKDSPSWFQINSAFPNVGPINSIFANPRTTSAVTPPLASQQVNTNANFFAAVTLDIAGPGAITAVISDANKPTFAGTVNTPGGFTSAVISDPHAPTFGGALALTAVISDANLLSKPAFAGNVGLIPPILPGAVAPIRAMAQFTPFDVSGYVATLMALTLDALGNVQILDVSQSTWSGSLANFTNGGPLLGGVQFSDSFIFALGLNIPPQIYHNGIITTIANSFQFNTNYPPWLPTTQYPRGARIIAAPTGSTTSYIYRAKHGGTSGTSSPSFPAAFHATVDDNGVVWINIGAAAAAGPSGAGFVFNHLNSLWVWGTASTYLANGIDGPDSLRMSDIGNPTSFDPANQDFVGQGDGQAPMGGGVWTQLEFGIPASPQLVIYKTKSTYSVLGAFPAASIQQIPNGVGCVAANTSQFVPGIGLMRLSHQGVAVFNGTRDEVDQYTDAIRPFLFPEQGANPDILTVDWSNIQFASSAQTINPPGYLLLVPTINSNGALNLGFFFDRLLKAWSVIVFPPSMLLGCGFFNTQTVPAGQSRTLLAGFSDGIIRQGFSGDEYWDTEPNKLIQWSFRTPPVGAPATPMFIRRLLVRAALRGTEALLYGVVYYDQSRSGEDLSTGIDLAPDAQQLSQAVDVGITSLGGPYFDIEGAGRAVIQGIEIVYAPKPTSRIPG